MMATARMIGGLALLVALAGCDLPGRPGTLTKAPSPKAGTALGVGAPAPLPLEQAARNFVDVIARVEPVAEAACRRQSAQQNCDFLIGVEMDPAQPPNAYQTLSDTGRPQIIFTISLIAEARNSDELAFVLGHEASHHILGHLESSQQEALNGAILGGILAIFGGADAGGVERAQQIGAQLGALRYSKDHELQADQMGTVLAYRAGYDPVLGAQFFNRLPDPGNGFLSSHPGNAERQRVVAQTYAAMSRE